jgi:hypothetical protein
MPRQEMKQSTNQGDVKLFAGSEVVTTINVGAEHPDVVVWQGRTFAYRNGSYHVATVLISNEAAR